MLYPLSYEGASHQGTCLRSVAVGRERWASLVAGKRRSPDQGPHADPTAQPMILPSGHVAERR
jgi:hypothetical protein